MRTGVRDNILELTGIRQAFRGRQGTVTAVDDVSLVLQEGESVGIIGESGAGKTTLGRIATGLIVPDAGTVMVRGKNLSEASKAMRREIRSSVGVVYQEPYGALDPRRTILASVIEPLGVKHPGKAKRVWRRELALETLERVGLDASFAMRYPGMLSGGQQQRVGIARAIITRPSFVLLDEPTSALDRSIRSEIVDLLNTVRAEEGLSYLVITHDVDTVAGLADRIAVMYQGKIVEEGATSDVLERPRDSYTKTLLAARLSLVPKGAGAQ